MECWIIELCQTIEFFSLTANFLFERVGCGAEVHPFLASFKSSSNAFIIKKEVCLVFSIFWIYSYEFMLSNGGGEERKTKCNENIIFEEEHQLCMVFQVGLHCFIKMGGKIGSKITVLLAQVPL